MRLLDELVGVDDSSNYWPDSVVVNAPLTRYGRSRVRTLVGPIFSLPTGGLPQIRPMH